MSTITRKTAVLLAITLLAAGLMCAPASAQTDDDDDDDTWTPIPILIGPVGTVSKPSPGPHGTFRADPDRAGRPRLHHQGLRPKVTAR
jgi:hypothetical protein